MKTDTKTAIIMNSPAIDPETAALRTFQETAVAVPAAAGLDHNPAAVYLAGLSAKAGRGRQSSRDTMRIALNNLAGLLLGVDAAESGEDGRFLMVPWQQLGAQHTAALRSKLADLYSYRYANVHLSALRGVLKTAWRLGLMSEEQRARAADIENIKGQTVAAGRDVPSGELAALLDTCDTDPTGVRDAAVIAILYTCGLRRAELVKLDIGDYDEANGRFLVHGKRNKQRRVPIGPARPHLNDWLAVRGRAAGALFTGTGNRQRHGRLTSQAIYAMLKRRAVAAGIPELSPHDFRRTFVGDLLDAGVDIVTVQKMAGHSSPETTARYDRRGQRAQDDAVKHLHVPYRRRVLRSAAGEDDKK